MKVITKFQCFIFSSRLNIAIENTPLPTTNPFYSRNPCTNNPIHRPHERVNFATSQPLKQNRNIMWNDAEAAKKEPTWEEYSQFHRDFNRKITVSEYDRAQKTVVFCSEQEFPPSAANGSSDGAPNEHINFLSSFHVYTHQGIYIVEGTNQLWKELFFETNCSWMHLNRFIEFLLTSLFGSLQINNSTNGASNFVRLIPS